MNRIKNFVKDHRYELSAIAMIITGPVIGTAMITHKITKERWTPIRIWPDEEQKSVVIQTKNKKLSTFQYRDRIE